MWGPASLSVGKFPGSVAVFPRDPYNKCAITQQHCRYRLFAIAPEIHLQFSQVEMSQFKPGTQRCFFPAQLCCCRSSYPRASPKVLRPQLASKPLPLPSLEKLFSISPNLCWFCKAKVLSSKPISVCSLSFFFKHSTGALNTWLQH